MAILGTRNRNMGNYVVVCSWVVAHGTSRPPHEASELLAIFWEITREWIPCKGFTRNIISVYHIGHNTIHLSILRRRASLFGGKTRSAGMLACACQPKYVHIYLYVYIYVYIHIYSNTYTYIYICTCM